MWLWCGSGVALAWCRRGYGLWRLGVTSGERICAPELLRYADGFWKGRGGGDEDRVELNGTE